jgi:hypothetical protein
LFVSDTLMMHVPVTGESTTQFLCDALFTSDNGLGMFVTQVTSQHQDGGNGVKRMHEPDRANRQAADIQPVNQIADVGHHQVAQAVGVHILGFEGFDQHWNVAADKQEGRNASGDDLGGLCVHNFASLLCFA